MSCICIVLSAEGSFDALCHCYWHINEWITQRFIHLLTNVSQLLINIIFFPWILEVESSLNQFPQEMNESTMSLWLPPILWPLTHLQPCYENLLKDTFFCMLLKMCTESAITRHMSLWVPKWTTISFVVTMFKIAASPSLPICVLDLQTRLTWVWCGLEIAEQRIYSVNKANPLRNAHRYLSLYEHPQSTWRCSRMMAYLYIEKYNENNRGEFTYHSCKIYE